MGYFANGTEGEMYEARYCHRCIHQGPPDGPGCSIMLLHLLHNYEECNKPDSMLHTLIPRAPLPEGNGQCTMFVADTPRTISACPVCGEGLTEDLQCVKCVRTFLLTEGP